MNLCIFVLNKCVNSSKRNMTLMFSTSSLQTCVKQDFVVYTKWIVYDVLSLFSFTIWIDFVEFIFADFLNLLFQVREPFVHSVERNMLIYSHQG